MLWLHMALLWSAKFNWFRSYKHVAALRPKTIIKTTHNYPTTNFCAFILAVRFLRKLHC